jgi:hypothetical protein
MARPKYNWKPKKTRKGEGTFTDVKNYEGVMYDFKRMPKKVEEYGKMAAIFSKSGKVRDFGYRGSEEGIHVSSRTKFSGEDRRSTYKYINVEFDGVYCDYYGEDAFVVDPLARARIYKGQWKGRRGNKKDEPGSDKCIEVHGGILEMRGKKQGSILIENAMRAVRGKTNSIMLIKNVDFVGCRTAIFGDGRRNPDNDNPNYFNGRPGNCVIYVRDCRFWDCDQLAFADRDCVIYWDNESNRVMSGEESELIQRSGGRIVKGSGLYDHFIEQGQKLRRQPTNEWPKKDDGNPMSW